MIICGCFIFVSFFFSFFFFFLIDFLLLDFLSLECSCFCFVRKVVDFFHSACDAVPTIRFPSAVSRQVAWVQKMLIGKPIHKRWIRILGTPRLLFARNGIWLAFHPLFGSIGWYLWVLQVLLSANQIRYFHPSTSILLKFWRGGKGLSTCQYQHSPSFTCQPLPTYTPSTQT